MRRWITLFLLIGTVLAVEGARRQASEHGVTLHVQTLAGHAAQSIVHAAQEGRFDLLVIGHSGRSGVWGSFLGGAADKIVRHAPCHVLVVR